MTSSEAAPKYFEAARLVWLPFALSRIWVAWWVYLGHFNHPFQEPIAGGYAGVSNWWLNPWTTFDSAHYLAIARDGYTPQTASFYPLLPLLLRLGGGDDNLAALLGIFISNLAFWLGLTALWRLTALDYSPRIATLVVWLSAFWPTGAFFSAVYTESLFLWLLVAAFWNARNHRWGRAAAWALAASLLKNSGFLIAFALWLEVWRARQSADDKTVPRSAFWVPLLPLLAFVGVQMYFSLRFGGAAGVASQQFYGRAVMWPWIPLWRDAVDIVSGRAFELTTLLNFGLAIIAIVIVWRDRAKQAASYTLLLGGILLMQFAYGWVKPPYSIATARYLSTTFPFVQRIAVRLSKYFDGASRLQIGILALMYALLCAVMSYLFGLKSFVG